MDFLKALTETLPGIRVLKDEPLKLHTTFRTGGPADYFAYIRDAGELKALMSLCRTSGKDFFLLGNGSNVLASDEGFRGLVAAFERPEHPILILERTEDGETVEIPAGAMLGTAARAIASEGLTGFEFAAGIPGTLGGAVFMNAGAYGGEIADSIISARVLMEDGEVREFTKDELALSYRHSILAENGGIVVSARFSFRYGNLQEINSLIEELNSRRREKQPLEYPSAGSTFKRPEGYFAGKLIQDAGLSGFVTGGAKVSEKHCGFVINAGNATSADIKALIDYIIFKVEGTSGVVLEPEVRFLGF